VTPTQLAVAAFVTGLAAAAAALAFVLVTPFSWWLP